MPLCFTFRPWLLTNMYVLAANDIRLTHSSNRLPVFAKTTLHLLESGHKNWIHIGELTMLRSARSMAFLSVSWIDSTYLASIAHAGSLAGLVQSVLPRTKARSFEACAPLELLLFGKYIDAQYLHPRLLSCNFFVRSDGDCCAMFIKETAHERIWTWQPRSILCSYLLLPQSLTVRSKTNVPMSMMVGLLS